MGNGLVQGLAQGIDDESSTAKHVVGERTFKDGVEYIYTQADDAITQYMCVSLDQAADSTGGKVRPCAAVADDVFGVAQIAVTDEYYFWCAVRGKVTAKIATAATAGQLLSASDTSGVMANPGAAEAHIRGKALEAGAATNAAKSIYLI